MAYMGKYENEAVGIDPATGKLTALASAIVTVFLKGTETLATIYSDEGVTAKGNPITTDALGRFWFYAADGDYDIQISKSGWTTYMVRDVSLQAVQHDHDTRYYTEAEIDAFYVALTRNQTIAGVKTFSDMVKFSRGVQVASAADLRVDTNSDGNYFNVTGTTTITSIHTLGATGTGAAKGILPLVVLKFDGALTLTHSSSLILPGAANITTYAGLVLTFVEESAGVWRCLNDNGGSWLTYTPTYASDIGNAAATFTGTPTTSMAKYKIIGKTMLLQVRWSATLLAVTPNYISFTIPTGTITNANQVAASIPILNNSVWMAGIAFPISNGTTINQYKSDFGGTNFTSGSVVQGHACIAIEIQ